MALEYGCEDHKASDEKIDSSGRIRILPPSVRLAKPLDSVDPDHELR